jgi:hypothetical protein
MRDVGIRLRDKLFQFITKGIQNPSTVKEQAKKKLNASDLFKRDAAIEIKSKEPSKALSHFKEFY